ncbi:MAG: hypothetical protein HY720_32800 [Planctomycetes bacterium]|nr:hypothetical protein [Planctomycetota bacterium]
MTSVHRPRPDSPLVRQFVASLLAVFFAPAASGQVVDSLKLRTSDGATQQPRLVVTTSTAALHAQIRVENGILRLSSTAEGSGDGGGDIRYDSGSSEVRYYDGGAWRTTATRTSGSMTQGGVIYASSGTNMASSAAGTSGANVLISGGTGTPTWGNVLTTSLYIPWDVATTNATGGSAAIRGSQSGGLGFGVYGTSNSTTTSYAAVAGVNTATSGTAVGLYGQATGGGGVGERRGVYGTASGGATNWAGYFSGNVALGGTATASELRFFEATGSGTNYTAFRAQAQAGDVTYTLPLADGTSGYFLTTNGTGTLSWSNSLPSTTTVSFANITGATNTSAAMLVGTGASLGPTGTGSITATIFTGSGSTSNAVDLATTEVSGTLAAGNGGTGLSGYAVGDILYASAGTTLSRLADVATGNALISGGVGVAPSWGKVGLTTHISGTLGVGNGGTGTATTFTQGSVVFAGASGIYAQDNANFYWNDTGNTLGLGIATAESDPSLHIQDSVGWGGLYASGSEILIDSGAGQRYITIRGPNSGQTGILFSNTDSFIDGGLMYYPSAVAGSEFMYVRSGGTSGLTVYGNGNVTTGANLTVNGTTTCGGNILNSSTTMFQGGAVTDWLRIYGSNFTNGAAIYRNIATDGGVSVGSWSAPGAGNLLVVASATLGNSTADSHRWWGTFNAGSTSDSHQILPNAGNWSYVGNATYYFYYMYSNNFIDPSSREKKRSIRYLDEGDYERLMADIDRTPIAFYKYKSETDEMEKGNEAKYRPMMHLGTILEEAPDYLQDNAFSGISLYEWGTIAVAGVKHNRRRLQELEERVEEVEKTLSRFGVATVQGEETWVAFPKEFAKRLSYGVVPVVTVTPNRRGVELAVVRKDSTGFLVTAGPGSSGCTFDWIAMADVAPPTRPEATVDERYWKKHLSVPDGVKTRIWSWIKEFESERTKHDVPPSNELDAGPPPKEMPRLKEPDQPETRPAGESR